MRTKILSTIILAIISLCVMAQPAERKTIIQKDRKGIVQSVEYSREDKTVSKGENVSFNTSGLREGMYFLNVFDKTAGKESKVFKRQIIISHK